VASKTSDNLLSKESSIKMVIFIRAIIFRLSVETACLLIERL
jgi:hypothetical protein